LKAEPDFIKNKRNYPEKWDGNAVKTCCHAPESMLYFPAHGFPCDLKWLYALKEGLTVRVETARTLRKTARPVLSAPVVQAADGGVCFPLFLIACDTGSR